MCINRSICVFAFSVFLSCSVQAYAQPLIDATPSIETTVINSDHVFIAKLLDFRPKKEVRDRYQYEGTISIKETLKCELFLDEPYRALNVALPYSDSVLQNWKERSSRLLVALTSYQHEQNVVIVLASETLEVMTAEVKLMRDPEALIRAARAAVKRLPANSIAFLREEEVGRLLSDEVDAARTSELEQHLANCIDCRQRLEQHVGDDGWWNEIESSLRSQHVAASLRDAEEGVSSLGETRLRESVLDLLGPTDNPNMLGSIGPYEIIGLLGQG